MSACAANGSATRAWAAARSTTSMSTCCESRRSGTSVKGLARKKKRLWPLFSFENQAGAGLTPALAGSLDRRRRPVDEILEALLFEVIVKLPALHLAHRHVEVLARQRLVDETLAPREFRVVPLVAVLEFRRHALLP